MSCGNCNKYINKTKSIINGYTNLLVKNDKIEPLAEERLKICLTCEHMKVFGLGNIKYCGKCFCVIEAKVRSKEETCEKWR